MWYYNIYFYKSSIASPDTAGAWNSERSNEPNLLLIPLLTRNTTRDARPGPNLSHDEIFYPGRQM